MCKYTGPSDTKYRIVVDTIKGFIDFRYTRELWNLIKRQSSSSTGKEPESAERESEKKMKRLLELGADPNLRNYYLKSALHQAVQNHKTLAIPTLVSEGADIDLPDGDGKTALQIAINQKAWDVCDILLQAGADESVTKQQGTSSERTDESIPVNPSNGHYIEGRRHDSNGVSVQYRQSVPLTQNCREASNNFPLTITSFCPRPEFPARRFVQEETVYKALYDVTARDVIPPGPLRDFKSNPFAHLDPITVTDKKVARAFTWYHLPANNVC